MVVVEEVDVRVMCVERGGDRVFIASMVDYLSLDMSKNMSESKAETTVTGGVYATVTVRATNEQRSSDAPSQSGSIDGR